MRQTIERPVSSATPPLPYGIWLAIDVAEQRLTLHGTGGPPPVYPVSTAARGADERRDSGGTPRGWHRVRIKIGADCPPGTVFRARRPTGEIWSPALATAHPGRDWILTRILWLTGLESGFNRGGEVDTLRRYIYLHGCQPDAPMGVPRSHGCVRLRDADLLELFARVPVGAPVYLGFGAPRQGPPEPSER